MELGLILIPFLLALLVPTLGRYVPKQFINWGIAGIMLTLFVWVLTLLPRIASDGVITHSYTWVEAFDLSIDIYIDGLAAIFALLITGIGAAVFLYAGYYLEGDERILRFYALLSAFTGSMLGVVLSGNLLLLFICWELTSVFSFTLIGFDGENPAARSAASQALVVTGGGGLALLAGLVLLGLASGSFSFTEVLQLRLNEHPWYIGIAALIMVGCFTKSAQFPFHFWLPGGMTAPTPASAFLHSATMVKAGVYLFARLYPTLGDTDFWALCLTTVGLVTMLIGAFNTIRNRDLKGLLAFATVSWLGTLVFLLGLPHREGYVAAIVGIIGHALYKSPLFMVAGAVDHAAGTRNIDRLGGLRNKLPMAALTTVIAGLSMAGVIPLLGFVAKELLLEVVEETHNTVALLVVLASAAFTVTAALILIWDVFFRPAQTATKDAKHNKPETKDKHEKATAHGTQHGGAHHINRFMLLGPAVIAVMGLVGALFLDLLIEPLVALANGESVSLYLFHGFNTVFMLSLLAIGVGFAIFLARGYWLRWTLPKIISGAQAYQAFIQVLNRSGDFVLRSQNGKLSHYLAVMLGVIGILLALPATGYFSSVPLQFTFSGGSDFMKVALLLLSLASILASILFKGHLLAALALGVAGYAVGGIFLLEPGPDVAMVQILVETLAAVLVIVMLSRITERKRRKAADALWGTGRPIIQRDLLVSVLVGVGVGGFALAAVVNRPTRESIVADWYLNNAQQVGVTDVVGAMITDFRGTDTLIEIIVFSMAAMGVLTVLFLTHNKGQKSAFQVPANLSQISTPLTRMAATVLLPVAIIIALAQLLYAGSAPGDGFTAGVIGGISVALWYQVFGYGGSRLRKLRPELLIGIGITLAMANAILPLLSGGSFLQHNNFGDVYLPANLHFTSTTIFEISIFLTVFGSVITMINAITNPEGIETL
jgi:NADH:ubiquinone oxidoreductase subunit 5 (subunit L)/multisubunit Na+/H+ antiporter MnhA subunit/multisubunit Na+/H+ antiporter MnhB subunit